MVTNGVSWEALRARHQDLGNRLLEPTVESHKRHAIQKEYAMLSSVLHKKDELLRLETQQQELIAQRDSSTDQEFNELITEELTTLDEELTKNQRELDDLLFPPNELNERNVFLEIRAGTGGQEAALFAGDLMRMYLLYAAKKGWAASVASASSTDLGGCREVVLHITGRHVYASLKRESGVHRVQRVPETETSGRVHTSTATVAVIPEATEVESATIDPRDLRIDVYRSSGAGGQHVNTTDSAVRITHIPTGLVVACQDERSQHKNKAKALKILQSRLRAAQEEKRAEEASEQRKKLIGTGERAEKVRTYNVPQNRVTDHQVELTLKSLDLVLEGNMDPLIDALITYDIEERRKQPLPWFNRA